MLGGEREQKSGRSNNESWQQRFGAPAFGGSGQAGAMLGRAWSQRKRGRSQKKRAPRCLGALLPEDSLSGETTLRQEKTEGYHLARMRYLRTEVPFLSTGTLNWAAQAAVFVNLYVEESISQSPPMGSLTSTVMGVSLWLRRVISNSISQTPVAMLL